ncbi:MAG: sensor histidine kinase [Nitrospirae bacterium]|nr:sensor histidine kinase [Nitrospirota bacterium]
MIKPLDILRSQINSTDFEHQKLFQLPSKCSNTTEIEQIYRAFSSLMDRLSKSLANEIEGQRLRHQGQLDILQNEADIKHVRFLENTLREKEILLQEIHHRVKNNLQIIVSLLNLQGLHSKDTTIREMLKESQNRIKSMALVHERLYMTKEFENIEMGHYVRMLMNNLFRGSDVDQSKIKYTINIENFPLTVDTALTCGLIINELVTNSLKYAFPDGRAGEIKISFYKEGRDIWMNIADNGIGIAEDIELAEKRSLGMHLVNILAHDQLDGTLEISRHDGVQYAIIFNDAIGDEK